MVRNGTKSSSTNIDLNFSFFYYLREFYIEKRGTIRTYYRDLTKKFLDFNDSANSHAFLRTPQFEALEMYVFLKEYLQNEPMHNLFWDWYSKEGKFAGRSIAAGKVGEQGSLFGELNETQYKAVFNHIKKNAQSYANYIFALTMGTGKTILMATCIFYEFILANKFPKDARYCHNALVFAPDRTVLESLKEIMTFDMGLVVPPEYTNLLSSHIQFHFLEEAGTTLNTLDKSRFNIIITNSQKVILKRQHKESSVIDRLFKSGKDIYEPDSVYAQNEDLYDFDTPEDEGGLILNQRFAKLTRLEQLGIYVDEAHHALGDKLAKDLGIKKAANSLRLTINELARSLQNSGTQVVACYNFTGTPYVGNQILPEVVYAYGLREAIEQGYLKKVRLHGYTNPRTIEFVRAVITQFHETYGEIRREGMLPKLAFFASTIEELENELFPAVEEVLSDIGLSNDRILINVGESRLTSNDDIREFNRLDTSASEKQYILLVNKGREGWNCRSLFGVALYRTPNPRNRIFVLQATMRCLRSIGDVQETANVYLSSENLQILEDELQQNFRLGKDDLENAGKDKQNYDVRLVPPPVKLKVKRVKRLFQLKDKKIQTGIDLELEKADTEKYRLLHIEQEGLTFEDAAKSKRKEEDLSNLRHKRTFSAFTLTAEIARYLNRSCLEIEDVLRTSKQGIVHILKAVNEFNELLYDWIIPRLFKEFNDIVSFERADEEEIALVKENKEVYSFRAKPELVIMNSNNDVTRYASKSFHLDTYCFDSNPEKTLFLNLLNSSEVEKIYFTGMLTHGQSDFYVHYIDPDSHTVRSYYPDFLVKKSDGTWIIVEVKGDNKIDDPVVLAKAASARSLASASLMEYQVIKGSEASAGHYHSILRKPYYIAAEQTELYR